MTSRQQQAQQLQQQWETDPRWKGIKRGYSADDVVRLRGSVQPEHTLARRGAEIIFMPAGRDKGALWATWRTLLWARAIENLSYVIAPAQSGFHPNGRETYGDTLIVDYWGQVLTRLPEGAGAITATFDLDEQASTRQRFPALENRRLRAAHDAVALT